MNGNSYKLGFQLYTTRKDPSQEVVYQTLAGIGFDAVEAWSQDYEHDAKSFRARVDAAGIKCMGIHAPFKGLLDNPNRYVEFAKTAGEDAIMIMSWMDPDDRPEDIAGWQRIGSAMGESAAIAKSAGVTMVWHNHDFEFQQFPDGSRPMDHVLAEAGNDLGFEIDVAWVTRAGADPVAELKKFASRIRAVHIKDTASSEVLDDEAGWRACGDGIIDWKSVWPLFRSTRSDYLVVEHDQPVDWRRTAQRSFDFANKMGLER